MNVVSLISLGIIITIGLFLRLLQEAGALVELFEKIFGHKLRKVASELIGFEFFPAAIDLLAIGLITNIFLKILFSLFGLEYFYSKMLNDILLSASDIVFLAVISIMYTHGVEIGRQYIRDSSRKSRKVLALEALSLFVSSIFLRKSLLPVFILTIFAVIYITFLFKLTFFSILESYFVKIGIDSTLLSLGLALGLVAFSPVVVITVEKAVEKSLSMVHDIEYKERVMKNLDEAKKTSLVFEIVFSTLGLIIVSFAWNIKNLFDFEKIFFAFISPLIMGFIGGYIIAKSRVFIDELFKSIRRKREFKEETVREAKLYGDSILLVFLAIIAGIIDWLKGSIIFGMLVAGIAVYVNSYELNDSEEKAKEHSAIDTMEVIKEIFEATFFAIVGFLTPLFLHTVLIAFIIFLFTIIYSIKVQKDIIFDLKRKQPRSISYYTSIVTFLSIMSVIFLWILSVTKGLGFQFSPLSMVLFSIISVQTILLLIVFGEPYLRKIFGLIKKEDVPEYLVYSAVSSGQGPATILVFLYFLSKISEKKILISNVSTIINNYIFLFLIVTIICINIFITSIGVAFIRYNKENLFTSDSDVYYHTS